MTARTPATVRTGETNRRSRGLLVTRRRPPRRPRRRRSAGAGLTNQTWPGRNTTVTTRVGSTLARTSDTTYCRRRRSRPLRLGCRAAAAVPWRPASPRRLPPRAPPPGSSVPKFLTEKTDLKRVSSLSPSPAHTHFSFLSFGVFFYDFIRYYIAYALFGVCERLLFSLCSLYLIYYQLCLANTLCVYTFIVNTFTVNLVYLYIYTHNAPTENTYDIHSSLHACVKNICTTITKLVHYLHTTYTTPTAAACTLHKPTHSRGYDAHLPINEVVVRCNDMYFTTLLNNIIRYLL